MGFELTADVARQLLDYDPKTGVFRWKVRTVDMFAADATKSAEANCLAWNSRHAGNSAGTSVKGYVVISIFGRRYLAHRLAWLLIHGEWPSSDLDHIDLDKSCNRISNLRKATPSQNQANKRARDSASGFKGIYWDTRKRKWRAQIRKDKKRYHLGLFDAPKDAHLAYQKAAELLHGEFARSS
jgi:hypothetical protein